MKLVSLVNSAESLEKTLALVISAYDSNFEFYNKFDEVIVFYSQNIIKKTNNYNTVGTLKSLLDNHILEFFYNCYDLNKIKILMLEELYKNHKITLRQKKKLTNNNILLEKILDNISWLEVLPDLEYKMIKMIKDKYKNVNLINMKNNSLVEIIQNIPHFQSFGKIYFYDYNGSTIMKKVNKGTNILELKNFSKNSLYFTFNVYIFLIIIYRYLENNNDIIFGYRPMKNTYRKAYSESLKYILDNYKNVIIEPQNSCYNNELSEQPIRLGDDMRTYNASYNILNKFLHNNQK